MKAFEETGTQGKMLHNISENTGAVLHVERSADNESSMNVSLWDRRTSKSAEQILAMRF